MESTILIIDDDEKLNRLLTNFLSEFGFKTLTAIHPEDGLKVLLNILTSLSAFRQGIFQPT